MMRTGDEATPTQSERSRATGSEPLSVLVSTALGEDASALVARLKGSGAAGASERRYRVLGEIGAGGMGRVLRVWDEDLQRELAMKVLAASASGSTAEERHERERWLARFVDEARVTSQLAHPGIVPVHEMGVAPSGDLFYTMPLVRGHDLAHVFGLVKSAAEGWSLARAIRVLHTVCETVGYAHERGVIHRDLKPTNVMVGSFGEAFVMDWGLALVLGRQEKRGVVGTLAYMAPEQARGEQELVGPRSDVYSLGAILYELLTGRMPFASSSPSAILTDPLDRLAKGPPVSVRELAPEVPLELAAICEKAMERRAEERYPSALALAEDLRAWLEGRVVSAQSAGRFVRTRKWMKRNPIAARALEASAALALVSLIAIAVLQSSNLRKVNAAHGRSEHQRYAVNLLAADLALRVGEADAARLRLGECPQGFRAWEWDHLSFRADSSLASVRCDGAVRVVASDPTGTLFAAGDESGVLRLLGCGDLDERARIAAHSGAVTALGFSPDGLRLASASEDHSVVLIDPIQGAVIGRLGEFDAELSALAWSHDGALLAFGDTKGGVHLRHAPDFIAGEQAGKNGTRVTALAFAPRTPLVVIAYGDSSLELLDVGKGESLPQGRFLESDVRALACDPRGGHIAAACASGAIAILDLPSLRLLYDIDAHARVTSSIAFSADGSMLASGSLDCSVRTWDASSGLELASYLGHAKDVLGVAFDPATSRVVSGSADDTVRLWDSAAMPITTLREAEDRVDSVALDRTGGWVVAGSRDGTLRRWDVAQRTSEILWRADAAPPTVISSVELSTDESCVAFAVEREALVLDLETLTIRSRYEIEGEDIGALKLSRDASLLYLRTVGGTFRTIELASGRSLADLPTRGEQDSAFALSSDERVLALAGRDGSVRIVEPSNGELLRTLPAGDDPVSALAFAPGDETLAVGMSDGALAIVALDGSRGELALEGHAGLVTAVAFDDTGTRLVSASRDKTLRIWDPASGELLLVLHGHAEPVLDAAWSDDGSTIASASEDRTVRVWRTRGVASEAATR